MKRSKMLFSSIFASFLAIASFSGVMAAKNTQHVEKAEAAGNATFYCIKNYGWTDLKIHYWGGSSSTSWDTRPSLVDTGVSATRAGVTGEVYKLDIPSDTTRIIVTGKENGNDKQTKDYTSWNPASNNAVYFSSWDSGANKAVLGACSYKNTSPSSTNNEFYVYDPHNNFDGLANLNVYGYGETDTYKPMSWPGTHSGITQTTLGIASVYKVALSTSYPNAIVNCGDGQNQTGNLEGISSKGGKVLLVKSGHSGKTYETEWKDASYLSGDYPSSTGYYIYGSKTSWTFAGATKMSAGSGGDVAQLLSYSGKKDEKIKVRGYYTDRDDPNIYSFYDGGNQPFGAGDGDANFVFSADMVVDIFAKYVSGELKFYVNEHFETDGYIMTGDAAFISATGKSGLAWSFNAGTVMDTPQTGTNKGSAVVTVTSTSLFRVRKHIDGNINWLNFPTAYDGTDGITRTSEGNVQLESGTYAIYVDASEGVYVVRGVPLDAFCSDFLNQIKDVCKTDGSTVLSQLKNTWSSLSSLYSEVFDSDKSVIYAIGFEGGSDADDAHKVVKAYHYIVTKYGTGNCNDFIWNQNVTGTYNQRIAILGNTTIAANNTIIVIVVVGVTALAVGGYFLLRKKKEN